MLNKLSRQDRLNLMKFVCSFAWADLHVQSEEREFVQKMVRRLELDDDDKKQVDSWLEVPPPPEDVDPSQVPAEHREIFLETIRALIAADSVFDPDEKENLKLFEMLLP